MKKSISMLLALLLLLSLPLTASAGADQSRVVIGADLDARQVEEIYAVFGIRRGDVVELSMTNAEERQYLEGFVDESLIGTRSISCVYMELLPEGSGISVSTSNVSWSTGEMLVSALATAGVTDADIKVAAPFEVSGTSALCGVYKAYEDMTGLKLDEMAKSAGTQELTVTGDLAEEIGSADSASIVNELKLMLSETRDMSDQELRSAIADIAERYHVRLTETQVGQLVSLCRTLEELEPDQLKKRVEDVQDTLQKMSEAKTKVVGFVQTLRNVIDSVADFFHTLSDLLNKFRS